MDCQIRRLEASELETALDLVWMTFLEFEAPDYGPAGVDTFRESIIDNPLFHGSCRTGKNRMWGAFAGDRLVGVMVLRDAGHITLAFVHRAFQRRGIGTAIFRALSADLRRENPETAVITVNSSPYGHPFYRRLGFVDSDGEQAEQGIRYTPMRYSLFD